MFCYLQKNTFKVGAKIVFVFLFVIIPSTTLAANLYLSPSTGSFEVGDTVPVKIIVTSGDVPFNAVSGVISVPTSIFSIGSVSKVDSVLDFWLTEPSISESDGTVKFEGVAFGGVKSAAGTVLTLNLHAEKAGEGQVVFQSGQVLANDGNGTDITGSLTGADYTVKEITPGEKKKSANSAADASSILAGLGWGSGLLVSIIILMLIYLVLRAHVHFNEDKGNKL